MRIPTSSRYKVSSHILYFVSYIWNNPKTSVNDITTVTAAEYSSILLLAYFDSGIWQIIYQPKNTVKIRTNQ